MNFLIAILTVVMVLDSLLLILLVLIQLPKKEAGAGLAFGGAATDALFGAGSGNVLTKITKYSVVIFFVLIMLLSGLQSSARHRDASRFKKEYEQLQKTPVPAPTQPQSVAPGAAPVAAPAGSNSLMMPLSFPTNSGASQK